MIRYYTPNALLRAKLDIAEDHPIKGQVREMDHNTLAALLKRINQCKEKDLEILAASLTRRENYALASYFSAQRSDQGLHKIARVLQLNMCEELFDILHSGWQRYPRNRELLRLIANCLETGDYSACRISAKEFRAWDEVFEDQLQYFVSIEHSLCPVNLSLGGSFEIKKLLKGSVLYYDCLCVHMTYCSWNKIINEGVDAAIQAIQGAYITELKDKIMLNILKQASFKHSNILLFDEAFNIFYRTFGKPDLSKFPVSANDAYETYRYWYNYQQLVKGFNSEGDRRRIDFWKQYLDRCDVTRFIQSQFLVMDYHNYVAIESEAIGTLYFFKKSYYEENVLKVLERQKKQDAKSWMKNFSNPVFEKRHNGQWEYEVNRKLREFHMV